jgi:hypothetical protein
MHVHLIELHILSGERWRSRSSFKVKGLIYGICPSVRKLTLVITFSLLTIAIWYLACMCISWGWTFWVVKGEGQMSNIWRLSVHPKTLTLAITCSLLMIATWYLACMGISWSWTFWVMKGQGHSSRSNVKYSVRPKTLTLAITFQILKIATWYLTRMCI